MFRITVRKWLSWKSHRVLSGSKPCALNSSALLEIHVQMPGERNNPFRGHPVSWLGLSWHSTTDGVPGTTEVYCPPVLEAGSRNQGLGRVGSVGKVQGRTCSWRVSPSCWESAGSPWHSLAADASPWSLPSSSRGVLLLCVSVGPNTPHPFLRTPSILDREPFLLPVWPHLNSLCP